MKDTADPRVDDHTDIFDKYPYYGKPATKQ
jgi:hypothetical protein